MNGATTLTSSHILRQTHSRGPEQWARSPCSVLSPVQGFLILYFNPSSKVFKPGLQDAIGFSYAFILPLAL